MITKFKIQQLAELMTIWLKTNIAAHSFIDPADWEDAYDLVASMLPTADIYLYEQSDSIAGFIGITDHNYIAGLFVSEPFQHQGIGTELLQYCQNRYAHLELDVFVKNEQAVKFYLKHGFKSVKTQLNQDFQQEEYHMTWSR